MSNQLPKMDLGFIDGHHVYNAVLHDFHAFLKISSEKFQIIFDDYLWSDYKSINQKVPNYNPEEFDENQIKKPNIKEVFHKLVMQHPNYSNFIITDDVLAWAQKKDENQVRFLSYESKASIKYKIIHTLKKIIGRNY